MVDPRSSNKFDQWVTDRFNPIPQRNRYTSLQPASHIASLKHETPAMRKTDDDTCDILQKNDTRPHVNQNRKYYMISWYRNGHVSTPLQSSCLEQSNKMTN
jgi:hypothetical protein